MDLLIYLFIHLSTYLKRPEIKPLIKTSYFEVSDVLKRA